MLEASMKEIVINHVQKSVFLAVLEFLYTDEMEIKLDMVPAQRFRRKNSTAKCNFIEKS